MRGENPIVLDVVFIIAQQKLNIQTFGMCCNLLKNVIYSLKMVMNSEASASVIL